MARLAIAVLCTCATLVLGLAPASAHSEPTRDVADRAVPERGAPMAREVAQPLSVTAPTLRTDTVLFVDNHRVARTQGLRRNYVPGTKVQVGTRPVGQVDIRPVRTYAGQDDAADGDVDLDSLYVMEVGTVMKTVVDGEALWQMWLKSGRHVGYRESDDGLH